MTPESSSPLPPLLIFFVGFFMIISLSRLATRPRARRANGRRFLDYNVIVIAFTAIFVFVFISMTVLVIWLDVGAAAIDRAAAIIVTVLWIIVDTGIFLAIYSMFRSKISFDDSGIYKKMIARPEKFFLGVQSITLLPLIRYGFQYPEGIQFRFPAT